MGHITLLILAACACSVAAGPKGSRIILGDRPAATPQPQDVDRLRAQAQTGSKDAHYFLGVLHYYGEGATLDHGKAYNHFQAAARAGHVQAQTNLAVMLDRGEGVAHDGSAAFAWHRAAAEAGEVQSLYEAGAMLYEGRVPGYDEHERYADAFKMFSDAAARGHAGAHYYLGLCYEYGLHPPQDFERAFDIYAEGCRLADPDCCYNQALMLAYGRGVPQDLSHALLLFQRAWDKFGKAGSAYYLGVMYANGQGAPVDYEMARLWLSRAVEAGTKEGDESSLHTAKQAQEAYEELDSLLTKAEAQNKATLNAIKEGIKPEL